MYRLCRGQPSGTAATVQFKSKDISAVLLKIKSAVIHKVFGGFQTRSLSQKLYVYSLK